MNLKLILQYAFCFLFFIYVIFYILSFCFLSGFLFYISSEIKVNELRKKQEMCNKRNKNTIVDKTVAKEKKAKDTKQETGNKKQLNRFYIDFE